MSDAPFSPGQHNRILDCPECGEPFAPRGLAAHRKMRHGIGPDAAVELAGTLSRIASVLERLDARLSTDPPTSTARPETPHAAQTGEPAAVRAASSSDSGRLTPGQLLQQGLHDVLEEIARVKRQTEDHIRRVNGTPMTDEEKALERTTYQALATLRRKQADLIYRMQTESGAGDDSIDHLASI